MKAAVLCMILACPLIAHPVKMVASWYGPRHEGKKMANGQRFNPRAFTCAHKTFPLGTRLRVWMDGVACTVQVTDRGPFIQGRDIDLSQAAALSLGLIKPGVCLVGVEVLGG